MQTIPVEFFSDGIKLRGFLRLPDVLPEEPLPGLVHGPGWLGMAEAQSYVSWHEGLTAAGYAVLGFDYRGFGRSDGERGWVKPDWQLDDWLNAVTYLESRPEVNRYRLGSFGIGGTGGGNAIYSAAVDSRIRAVVAQSVVADGEDWLHRMRREYEWVAYKERIDADRRRWALEGTGEKVNPREDLMVETPERRAVGHKRDVDGLIEPEFYLKSAEYIMRYRPIDVVAKIAPRAVMITSVVDDVVTPEDHAVALYEAAGAPKKIIRQSETTHYRSYTQYFPHVMPQVVDWFDRYLAYSPVQGRETALTTEEVVYLEQPGAPAAAR